MSHRSFTIPSALPIILAGMLVIGATPLARAPELALSKPLTLRWHYDSDRTSNFTPATDGDIVYVPLSDGTLIALSEAEGQLRWKAEAGGDFSAAPAVDDHNVYLATQYPSNDKTTTRGTLRALSKDTGITLWMRTLQSPLRGGLAAGPGAIFAGAANGDVYAFDKRSGLTTWINHYGDEFDAQPIIQGDRLYIGSVGGWLRALNQTNGDTIWRVRTRGAIRSPVAVADGAVFFGSDDAYVYALRERDGKQIWKRRTGAAAQAVAVVDDGVLASSLDNFAYMLSLKHGSVRWRQLLPGRVPARPVTSTEGALFTPLSTDIAIVLNLKDGKPLNQLQIGEENSSSAAPIATDTIILITTPHKLMAFAESR